MLILFTYATFFPLTIPTDKDHLYRQTGSKVQGRRLELIQVHFIDHDFLLKYLVWDGHVTRDYALIWFLLYVLGRPLDPQNYV